jgi:hypothetical protein
MHIVSDDVDGSYYIDLIISPSELKKIKRNDMISGEAIIKKKRYYLGIRLQGIWDYEEEDDTELPEG